MSANTLAARHNPFERLAAHVAKRAGLAAEIVLEAPELAERTVFHATTRKISLPVVLGNQQKGKDLQRYSGAKVAQPNQLTK
jgi:hypothetical protein